MVKKVKMGVVMIYPSISYLISISVPASLSSDLGNDGQEARAAQNQDCSDFLHFSQRLPATGGWGGGARLKP